jgi:hypothetical protein
MATVVDGHSPKVMGISKRYKRKKERKREQ